MDVVPSHVLPELGSHRQDALQGAGSPHCLACTTEHQGAELGHRCSSGRGEFWLSQDSPCQVVPSPLDGKHVKALLVPGQPGPWLQCQEELNFFLLVPSAPAATGCESSAVIYISSSFV